MGAFNLIVHGFVDDPQEVYAIEEVRAYHRRTCGRSGPTGCSSAIFEPQSNHRVFGT